MTLLERGSWMKLIISGASSRGRVFSLSLCSAGDTGRATILTGRDHGEDSRQLCYCRGQARGETRRARLHQQALHTQIRPATISRSRQCHLDPLLGWCTNCHGAQKGTTEPRPTFTFALLSHPRTQPRTNRAPFSLSPTSPFSHSFSLSRLCYSWCGLRYMFEFFAFWFQRFQCCASVCGTRGGRWCRWFWIKLRVCSKLQNRIWLVNVRNLARNVCVDKAHFFLHQCASILRKVIYWNLIQSKR